MYQQRRKGRKCVMWRENRWRRTRKGSKRELRGGGARGRYNRRKESKRREYNSGKEKGKMKQERGTRRRSMRTKKRKEEEG